MSDKQYLEAVQGFVIAVAGLSNISTDFSDMLDVYKETERRLKALKSQEYKEK